MTLTYEWKLRWLKKANTTDFDDVVIETHWVCTGTDEDGDTGEFGGTTSFDANSVDSDGFIVYEELAESDVISWVEESFNDNYRQYVESEIMRQINEKKMAVVSVPESQLPWANTASI